MSHDPPQNLQVPAGLHSSALNGNAEAGPSVPKSTSTTDGTKKRKKKKKRPIFKVEDDSEVEGTPNDDNAPAPNEEAEYVVDAILCATYRNFAPSRNKPGLAWHYTIQWHGYTQTQTSAEYPITADMFGEVGNFVAEFWAHAETPRARGSSINRKAHPSEPTGKKGDCQMCPPQLLVKWYRSALRRYRDEKRKVDAVLKRGPDDDRDRVIRTNLVWWIQRTKIDLGDKTEECGRRGLPFLPDDSSDEEDLSERSPSPPRKKKKKRRRSESPNNIEKAATEVKETKRLMLEKLKKKKAARRTGAVQDPTVSERDEQTATAAVQIKVEPSGKPRRILSPEATEEPAQFSTANVCDQQVPSPPPTSVPPDDLSTPLFMAEGDEEGEQQPVVKDHRPIWERAGRASAGDQASDPAPAQTSRVSIPVVPSLPPPPPPPSSPLHVPQEPSVPILELRDVPARVPPIPVLPTAISPPPSDSVVRSERSNALSADRTPSRFEAERIVKSSVSLRLPGSSQSWPLFDCTLHVVLSDTRNNPTRSLLTLADDQSRPIEICRVLSQGAIQKIALHRSVIAHAMASASTAKDNKQLSHFISELDRSQLDEGIAVAQYQPGIGVLLYSTASRTASCFPTPPSVLSSHGLAAVFLRIDFGKNPIQSGNFYQPVKSMLRHITVSDIYPGTRLGSLGITGSFLRDLEGKRITVMGSLMRDAVKADLGLIGFESLSHGERSHAILLDEAALTKLSSVKNLRAAVDAGTEFWLYGPSSTHQHLWGPQKVLDIAGGLVYISPSWLIEKNCLARLRVLLKLVETFPGWYAYTQPQALLLLTGRNSHSEDLSLDSLPELLFTLPISQADRLERLSAIQALDSARTFKQKVTAASAHIHIGLSARELGVLMDSRESVCKKAQSLEMVGLNDFRRRRNHPINWRFPKSYVLSTVGSPAMSMQDIECVDEDMLEKLLRCGS